MKKCFCLLVCVILSGCLDREVYEYSDVLSEPAKVITLVHSPRHSSSDVVTGITGNGDLTITPVSVQVPESWGVVFECKHGRFVINRKELFDTLSPNQNVTIQYREIYICIYDYDKKQLKTKKLIDYDFLDAIPENKPEQE
jgi:hypothetical protein